MMSESLNYSSIDAHTHLTYISRVDEEIRSCQLPEIQKKRNEHEEKLLKIQREKELSTHRQPKKELIIHPYGRPEPTINKTETDYVGQNDRKRSESSQPSGCEGSFIEKAQVSAKENTKRLGRNEENAVSDSAARNSAKSKW